MFKRVMIGLAALIASGALLFMASGRGLREYLGYARAAADSAAEGLTDQLPDDVRDRKLSQDLEHVRQELINGQVRVNESKTRIARMREEFTTLTASLERRKRLLAEAYPILERATRDKSSQVRFASASMPLGDFQREVDDLLTLQKREQTRHDVLRESLERQEASLKQAEATLEGMKRDFELVEHESETLKDRRDQAQVESKTLEMTSSLASDRRATSDSAGESLRQLREQVGRLEAENDAKRTMAPASERESNNQLSREWSRLESLKAIHDREQTGKID